MLEQLVCLMLFCLNMLIIWLTIWRDKGGRYRAFGILIWTAILIYLPFTTQPRMSDILLWRILGMAITLVSVVLLVLARLEFRKVVMWAKDLPPKLVTTGAYSVMRHPQYLGFITFFVGWSLFWDAVYCLYLIPAIIFLHWLEAFLEEKYILERTFGQAYEDYERKVGMFWPRLSREG